MVKLGNEPSLHYCKGRWIEGESSECEDKVLHVVNLIRTADDHKDVVQKTHWGER